MNNKSIEPRLHLCRRISYLKILLITISVCFIFISGCSTPKSYQSEGLLNLKYQSFFEYKHAAISPESGDNVKKFLAQALKSKGFTVYTATSFRKVLGIKSGNPVLVFKCYDAGTTDRPGSFEGGGAYSQAVECLAYDLHSEEIIYEGFGEYMGPTVADDFKGAILEALKNLPSTGTQGIITSIIRLPHDKSIGSRKYRRQKEGYSTQLQGTAWMMPSGYIVTSHHVIEGASEIKLIKTDGSELIAKEYINDKANDIALLEVISKDKLPAAIPISSKPASLGSDVFTIGYPMVGIMGTNPKFTAGKINSLSGIQNDPRIYQISVPVQSGNSGGPLLNENGEVVGIITSKLHAVGIFKMTGDLPQNVNYAIKAQYITLLPVDRSKQDIDVLIPEKGTFEELVVRLKDSVLMVITE